jgi:hypothetical protein
MEELRCLGKGERGQGRRREEQWEEERRKVLEARRAAYDFGSGVM